MNRRVTTLLLLAACHLPESGLDHTVLTGTLSIPPAASVEDETRTRANDDAATAFGLGVEGASSLTYRAVVLTGETSSFTPTGRGAVYGDPDFYLMSPVADGAFTITFALSGTDRGGNTDTDTTSTSTGTGTTTDTTGTTTDTTTDTDTTTTTDTDTTTDTTTTGTDDTGGTSTGTDTGGTSTGTDTGGTSTGTDTGGTTETGTSYVDPIVFLIRVYDAALYSADDDSVGIVAEGTTEGAAGAWTGTFDVAAGSEYLVLIAGIKNTTGTEEVAYQATFSGSKPGEDAILVGAYPEGDPAVGSAPLGGAAATDWLWNSKTLTWHGSYSVKYVRSVVNAEVDEADTAATEDAEGVAPPTIDEKIDTVFLMAGTLTSLNKTPSAGSLYTSASIEVTLNGNAIEAPAELVLDAVFPKVIGIVSTETLPDTTFADVELLSDSYSYGVDASTIVAQDVGMLSGLGYVDVFDGGSDMTSGVSGWDTNDSDAFAFTVPESMYARVTLAWEDSLADLDLVLAGPHTDYGYIDYTFGGCAYINFPESCETYLTVEPDVTYYLVVLGYTGTDIEPYHVELEWVAP